ncbi:MAG: hypothetical protein ACLGQW_10360 [Acidobacteriota bacterium]
MSIVNSYARNVGVWFSVSCALIIQTACVNTTMNVKAASSLDSSWSEYKSFYVYDIYEGKNIDSKLILSEVSSGLIVNGYVADNTRPDMIVLISFATESVVDKADVALSRIQSSLSDMQMQAAIASGSSSGVQSAAYNKSKALQQMATPSMTNLNKIRIIVVDSKSMFSGRKPGLSIIWNGEVQSEGGKKLMDVYPCLVKGALEEFTKSTPGATKSFANSACLRR